MSNKSGTSFGQPSYLKYGDKFYGQCHKKLHIRVVSSRARNYQKLFYFCHGHTFDSWCNPINEQELHQEGESATRDGNAVKDLKLRKELKKINNSLHDMSLLLRFIVLLVSIIMILAITIMIVLK
ncbi:hypothetical protein OROGR_001259 [Orobanche gracilis]